ncbi:uncharacterized protein BO80DRAFT_433397 [Aspergillus ibericus CBS 121593]|uniref:Uncharacterized protein n=1 Tax=Aspergillus ibericus CBS 121593 TaxID=1448316 RepID=A0A395H499_9EURO|nr:hypothetical protein BO80DRAFT_433397 [Aspergillus ibericus CBS 121593]RAL02576.1 hypothetical protein BO80DRAFT_433397 [Aspergillus ibericus CBS 121593]
MDEPNIWPRSRIISLKQRTEPLTPLIRSRFRTFADHNIDVIYTAQTPEYIRIRVCFSEMDVQSEIHTMGLGGILLPEYRVLGVLVTALKRLQNKHRIMWYANDEPGVCRFEMLFLFYPCTACVGSEFEYLFLELQYLIDEQWRRVFQKLPDLRFPYFYGVCDGVQLFDYLELERAGQESVE